MKVTRLRRGYRLHLSDSEYEALSHMHVLAGEDIADDPDGAISTLSPAAKATITTGRLGRFGAMDVDEDRRQSS